ncbi:MAG: hypothetical protein Q9221_005795 [Calogaya cf. arnoldii]
MARLEDLPPELIEMIFFESLNLGFPKASPRLGAALASFNTKIKLVTKVFSSNSAFNIAHYGELSRQLWTGDPSTTEDAIGQLQSDILSCRWMTWEFLKAYFEAFITKIILCEFDQQNLKWEEGQVACDFLVREYVHGILYQDVGVDDVPYLEGLDYDPPTTKEEWDKHFEDRKEQSAKLRDYIEQKKAGQTESGTDTEDEEYCSDCTDDDAGSDVIGVVSKRYEGAEPIYSCHHIITSALMAKSWKLDDEVSKAAIGIGRRTGLVLIGSRLTCQNDKTMCSDRSRRWRSLFCPCGPSQIPAKLLSGPWTDEKLHFLEAVLEAGAYITNKEHDALAEKGLMDAISEDNYRAVDILATRSCDEQYEDPHKLEGTFAEPSMGEAGFTFDLSMEGVSAFVDTLMPRRTCDIHPTTEHLKAAVIERNCPKMVVRRLLFAQWAKIDAEDAAIVEWIEEKKKAGNEKGKWLECQLEKSSKMQPKKRANSTTSSDCCWDLGGGSDSDGGSSVGNFAIMWNPFRRHGGALDDSEGDQDEEDEEAEDYEGGWIPFEGDYDDDDEDEDDVAEAGEEAEIDDDAEGPS